MSTAGSIVIDLLMRTGAFETDSKRAEKRLKELEKSAIATGKAIGAGIAVGAVALTAITVQAINFADSIDEMSQRLGISTETLSGWGYAAKLSGTSLDALSSAVPKLSKNLAAAMDEGSRMGQLFKTLGVDVKDTEGNLRGVDAVLPEIADRFKALDNDTTEAALAMELFGKSGAELLEFLNRGSDGIRELTDRAEALGIVIGSDTAAAAADFNDKVDDLRAVTMAFGLILAEELLPALTELVDWMVKSGQEGQALRESMSLLGDVSSFLVEEIKKSDDVGKSFTQTIMFLHAAVDSLRSGLSDLLSLDLKGFIDNLLGAQKAASGALFAGFGVFEQNQESPTRGQRNTRGGSNRTETGGQNLFYGRELEQGVNRFFSNVDKGSSKAKKQLSEAEQEAKRLKEAFESTLEGLERQQYMLGKTGEEARIRYEIELGSLKTLDEFKKQQLLTEAAAYDIAVRQREEAEKKLEADNRATEAFERMNKDIVDQIELISMSAEKQEIWNNLAWAGVDAESARGKEIVENTKRLQAAREAMGEQIYVMDSIRDAGKDFFMDFTSGSKSFKDSFLDALESIHQKILAMIAENLMDQLFGKQGDPAGGLSGGWFGSLMEVFTGKGGGTPSGETESGFGGLMSLFFGGSFAGGGGVFADRPILVGEQGPEMFVPRTAGTILANEPAVARNGGIGGGRPLIGALNFNGYGRPDRRTAQQAAADMASAANRALVRNGRG